MSNTANVLKAAGERGWGMDIAKGRGLNHPPMQKCAERVCLPTSAAVCLRPGRAGEGRGAGGAAGRGPYVEKGMR